MLHDGRLTRIVGIDLDRQMANTIASLWVEKDLTAGVTARVYEHSVEVKGVSAVTWVVVVTGPRRIVSPRR